MCDFKPGDEVVAVDCGNLEGDRAAITLTVGQIYVCVEVAETDDVCPECGSTLGVDVEGAIDPDYYFCPCSFRKVQKRNDRLTIEAFSTIKDGFEEPRRAPAKKRERVQ